MGQGGIGMPDRNYYLEAEFAAKKAAYQTYIATVLGYAGWANPAAAAKTIVDLETRIAEAHWTRAEGRDRTRPTIR
jgi:putative endopeptidase